MFTVHINACNFWMEVITDTVISSNGTSSGYVISLFQQL